MKDYPTSGPFKGNAFALKDANPYLIDSTFYSYGQALSFSENIYTKVTKRDDPSCINLTARFDFTDSSLTNTVRFDFLKNYTARKYEELAGVLPIIKNGIKFRVHYTIYNIDGGIEYIGHTDCKVDNPVFHFTSIKDVFVQSSNGLIIENIPAMTYQGRYTITINNVEAMIEVIDTKAHLQDPSLNPFYTFEDNNRKILLHNTEISQQEADDVITIGTCAVEQSFEYLANISTRLRLNFIAFTSLPIACGDTSPIWFALNEPTEATITQLRNEVSALEDEVAALHAKDASQDAVIEQLSGQVELNKNNIIALTNELNAEKARNDQQDQIINTLISRIDALTSRVSILEAIPRALVTYKAGKEFQSAQITWKGYGNLYQATEDFTASGIFDSDVANGHLIPVATSAADLTAVLERVEAVETTANAASETATTAESGVSAISTTVGELETTVSGHTTSIESLDERVTALEPHDNNQEEPQVGG
jgi:phage shock protein A